MSKKSRQLADVTVKVDRATHREIRHLAADLGVTNAQAVAYAVQLAREHLARQQQEPSP